MGEQVLSSDLIDVSSFQEAWTQLANESAPVIGDDASALAKWMNVDDAIFHEIESLCDVSNLFDTATSKMSDLEFDNTIPEDTKLSHLSLLAEERQKTLTDEKARMRRRSLLATHPRILCRERNSKYPSKQDGDEPSCSTSTSTAEASNSRCDSNVNLNDSEVVLRCKVYRLDKFTRSRIRRWLCDQEFEVLGSQHLTALRDAIVCACDLHIPFDVSNRLDLVNSLPRCTDLCKSAMLFIEDKFYIDMRQPFNVDYSQHIREFVTQFRDAPNSINQRGEPRTAASSDCGWLPREPFEVRNMENVTFGELRLRLGMPCLYQHQANCQHLIVFSDLRMLNRENTHRRDAYPLQTGYTPARRAVCKCCEKLTARWLVRESQLCPDAITPLCNACFRMLHYDRDGQKLCEFRAYLLPDRNSCLQRSHRPSVPI